MNPQQAENLRAMILHMEGVRRMLDMTAVGGCGTPGCAMGEACMVPALQAQGLRLHRRRSVCGVVFNDADAFFADVAKKLFGVGSRDVDLLFSASINNAWGRSDVTPQEWATEARKVLAENGYAMDDTWAAEKVKQVTKPDPIVAVRQKFLSRVESVVGPLGIDPTAP